MRENYRHKQAFQRCFSVLRSWYPVILFYLSCELYAPVLLSGLINAQFSASSSVFYFFSTVVASLFVLTAIVLPFRSAD